MIVSVGAFVSNLKGATLMQLEILPVIGLAKYYSPPSNSAREILKFPTICRYIVKNKVIFTETIIHLNIGESGGCSPLRCIILLTIFFSQVILPKRCGMFKRCVAKQGPAVSQGMQNQQGNLTHIYFRLIFNG